MLSVIKLASWFYINGKRVVAPFDVVISCYDFCLSRMF